MSEARIGNRNHLLRLWAWPLLIMGLMLVSALLAAGRRNVDLIPFYCGAAAFVLVFGYIRLLQARAKRRFAQLLLEPTPEPILAYTRTMFSRARTPHVDLLQATSLAFQRAIYGQFGRALDELDVCDWSAAPAMYRASMLQARALVHFLSRDDRAAGLRAAKEAEALAEMPRLTPGAERVRRGTQLYIGIGRVLCEGASAELAAALDRSAAAAEQPLDHAISLWACALAQASLGNDARVAALRAQLAKLAPHCAPLQRTDPDEQAAPGEIAARAVDASASRTAAGDEPPRRCALHVDTIAEVCCIRCGSFACKRCARAVSELASICADCTARYRELRERNLAPERRLRAAGLFLQIGAIGLFTFMALSVLISAFAFQFQWYSLLSLAFVGLMMAAIWRTGRNIRGMCANWRVELRTSALPLLVIVPFGSLLAIAALWQLSQAPFDAAQVAEYQRAVRVTPELAPQSLWPLALGAGAAIVANVVLGVAWVFVLVG